ncbi:MAG: DUF2849 domain-containing protein [Rhodospirillaceae bacterium]|nr:DUF2849 domain-containing protein [Rhodospirillaceae bacterium]
MSNDRPLNQMVTAQWLLGGESIYWVAGKGWSDSFAEGTVYADQPAADAALAEVQEFVKQRVVVGPYLIEVEVDSDGPKPTSARERIRAAHNATFDIDHGSWTARIAD